MTLLWAILLLPIGIAALVKGAGWLIDGAVVLAEQLGMTPLIIGLTIVAMGTSAPEIATSVAAALSDTGDIAVGNVYGSNIANLVLVGGLCAVIRPIAVQPAALRRDIPLMLGAIAFLWFALNDTFVSRPQAALLIAVFIAILALMIHTERRRALADRAALSELETRVEKTVAIARRSKGFSILLLILGLICLAGGAHLTVLSASHIGRVIGISDAVIGLTIVAVGTSLPELAACLAASIKGHDDLSVGNLVGSNIFNTLLVIGTAGLVRPFEISNRLAGVDFWLMAGASVLFAAIAFAQRRINRPAGLFLFTGYCGYMVYLFIQNG